MCIFIILGQKVHCVWRHTRPILWSDEHFQPKWSSIRGEPLRILVVNIMNSCDWFIVLNELRAGICINLLGFEKFDAFSIPDVSNRYGLKVDTRDLKGITYNWKFDLKYFLLLLFLTFISYLMVILWIEVPSQWSVFLHYLAINCYIQITFLCQEVRWTASINWP